MKQLSQTLTWSLLVIMMAGCGSSSQSRLERVTRTELYLGLDRANAPQVSDQELQAFLDEVVTPLFPAGYTVMTTEGRWHDGTKTIREPSRMLVFLHSGDRKSSRAIEQIRQQYKQRFEQQAVLRADSTERISF